MSKYNQANVEEIIEGCREETARFHRKERGSTGFCYELFRRAVVESCQESWNAIDTQYRSLLLRWAEGNSGDAEDMVQLAWEKFFKAMTEERFLRFPGIAHILAYLRRCVNSVTIDHWRKIKKERSNLTALGVIDPTQATPLQQTVLDGIVNRQHVERVYSRLKDRQERLVVYLNFELGLKPAEIAQLYPDVFPSARDVSRVKERVIRRLSNDPTLRGYNGP